MKTSQDNDDVLPTALPILKDRWFEPFRTPWRRRAVALVWCGLIVAMIVLIAIDARVIGVGLPALFVGSLLNVTMRNMADAPADRLDERMVAVRDHAFRLAYYGVGVAVVGGIAVTVGLDQGPVTIDKQQLVAIGWCVALVAMALPAAILAWTEEAV